MNRLFNFRVAFGLVVLLAFCVFAFAGAGVPVDMGSADQLSALSMVPMVGGLFRNNVTNIQPAPAANSTVTVTLGVGRSAPTLDRLQFILGGTTFDVSHISAIRGFMNGREFYREGTGTVHNARRTYMGLSPVTSELVLDFTEPNAKSQIEQNLSALPLSLLDSCYFEIDIGAATAPTLACNAHFRAPTQNPFVKKQRRLVQAFANAGEQVVYLPTGPNGGKLYRVWIHEAAAGNITAVELRARNAIGIEATRTQLERSQASWGLTAQAGVVVLDFIEDGNLGGWFDTSALSDVELRLTGTAATTYTIYFEYLDPINRL